MKFSSFLGKHNLYRMMRNQWKVARKRRIISTGAEDILNKYNLEVVDANEFVAPPKKEFDFSTIVGLAPFEKPKDEQHPLYKEQPCYMFKDDSSLLEGLLHALVLTNSVQLKQDLLPDNIENRMDNNLKYTKGDEIIKRIIKASCLYDAEQKKLPKRKDPERPAWNFPRDYGITDVRKNRMLCSRLIHLCNITSPDVCANRVILHNVPISVPLQLDSDQILLELRNDIFISSDKPCTPISDGGEIEGIPLPELNVSHPLISLHEENFYELKDVFPLKEGSKCNHAHTIMIHYNNTEVKNIFETPVTEEQMIGRSLMKAFTTAVAQARFNFGKDVTDVPTPIVIHCVQTDGKRFHFSVFQLNNADISSNQRNIYWSLPLINLYEDCSYVEGLPVLDGYNPKVFKYLKAFYNNN